MDTNVVNRVFLYGLDEEYRVIHYTYVDCAQLRLRDIMFQASMLKENHPNIKLIYAADNSYTVYRACQDAMRKASVEDRVLFKTVLEAEGMRVLI